MSRWDEANVAGGRNGSEVMIAHLGPLRAVICFRESEGRYHVAHVQVTSDDRVVPNWALRELPVSRYLATMNCSQGPATSAHVDPPVAKPYGDEFYQRVAAAYAELIRFGRAPGPALAEANNVPRTTVHRWIREARRRGIMRPGVPGSVG